MKLYLDDISNIRDYIIRKVIFKVYVLKYEGKC